MIYLNEHLKRYPEMQLEDKLKLCLQGVLGNGHLVTDEQRALFYMEREYESISADSSEMIEEISDQYVRVYLYPYFERYKSFGALARAFVLSSSESVDINKFISEVEKLKNEENADFIDGYLFGGNYLISHSEKYKEKYAPHYRVIHKKYLKIISEV